MQLIGDIERFVAQNLYPWRGIIATAVVLVLVGLFFLARRRGWFATMRRHRVWTTVAVVALIVVLGPAIWYLASPLITSTTVVEAAPSSAPEAAASAPVGSAEPSAVVEPEAAERSGSFVGADEFHFGSGTARLIPGPFGTWTLRFEGFAVRNGPDLYVYLSADTDGYAEGALELGTLKADTGAFNYELPAAVDPNAVASVVVWCKQFAVQFAHATLAP